MSEKSEKTNKTAETIGKGGKAAVEKTRKAAVAIADGSKHAAQKAKEKATKAKDTVFNAIDQDGNGHIDSADLILMALKVPGIKINRADFLKKELFKHYPQDVIDKAIESTPANAGIDSTVIDVIADDVIKFERNAVSGISLALGIPGGAAMAATIPADIAQYYGYMIRAAQKLLYLYGFPELDISENDVQLDSGTLNSLTLCLGIMYGVAGANNAIKGLAKALGAGVEKQLMNKALTKGVIYPIVKSVAKWFGVRMTKEVFAGFFKKAIPVVGGVVGGGITFATFKPCCYRLKDALKDTILSNPNHKETEEELKIYEDIKNGVIDVEADEIVQIEDQENDENE